MMAHVEDCKFEHIAPVAINMRADDVREIWCSSKSRPLMALKSSFFLCPNAKTIMVDDKPAAIFGINRLSVLNDTGIPWLLGTPKLEGISYKFVKYSRIYLQKMSKDFARLENHVDARNTASIKWLRWLGFDIMEAKPYGPFEVLFHKFSMEVKDV